MGYRKAKINKRFRSVLTNGDLDKITRQSHLFLIYKNKSNGLRIQGTTSQFIN
jgi:hypothetical protein